MRKRSSAELIVWFLYAVAVIWAFWVVVAAVSLKMHGTMLTGLLIGILLTVGAGGLAYLVRKCRVRAEQSGKRTNRMLSAVAETLLFLAGLTVMVMLRLSDAGKVSANALFEEATVSLGQFHPTMLHNGCRLYLYLLHGSLFLFGNKIFAGVILQILLQVGAVFFFYFAVRRLSGVPASVVTLLFFCFSPYLTTESLLLTPLWMFVFCFGVTLWLLTGITASDDREPVKMAALLCRSVIAGLFIGFCCFLDPTGMILLVFLIGAVFSCASRKERIATFLAGTVSAVLGYMGLCIVRAGGFGALGTLLYSQKKFFVPGILGFPFDVLPVKTASWDMPVLLILAAVGILGFFYHRDLQDRVMWLSAAAALAGMQCLGMASNQPFNTFVLLYLFFVALAGCSMSDIFCVKENEMETQNLEVKQDVKEEEKPRYLENPLPLPKKHERRVLDYDYDVSEDDDFDI